MRRTAAALVAALVATFVPGAAHAKVPVPPTTYPAVFTQRDVRIAMRDGVTLSADVLFPAQSSSGPAAPGTFPVVLTQTPYNKNGLSFSDNDLVQHGYIQVIAEVRGTGSSDGIWHSFDDAEQLDGVELVRWAVAQPWSNGSIALHGTSYAAINQFLTVERTKELDPTLATHIKAMFPIVPMSDAYRDITDSGGQVNTSFIPSWLGLVTALGLVPPTYPATQNDPQGVARMYADHAQGVQDFQASTVLSATQGGETAFDGPFYRTRSPIEKIDSVDVPTFIVGGWFDLFQRGEPLLFQKLQPRLGNDVRLLMGPWYHTSPSIQSGLPTAGMEYSLEELEVRWFNHYVKGAPDALDDVAPVTYWHLGASGYQNAESWPPAGVTYTPYYLSHPALTSAGTLQSAPAGVEVPDQMLWQPASGACTRSTVQWTAGDGQGTPCETDNEANDQTGLTFDLPLANGMRVAGPLSTDLFVSTDGHDAFLTARVEDVDANGRASQISAGWNVLSMRALDDAKSEIVDGQYVRPYHPFTQASALPVQA